MNLEINDITPEDQITRIPKKKLNAMDTALEEAIESIDKNGIEGFEYSLAADHDHNCIILALEKQARWIPFTGAVPW